MFVEYQMMSYLKENFLVNDMEKDYFELIAEKLNIDLVKHWSIEDCILVLRDSSKEEIKLEYERIFADGDPHNRGSTKEWVHAIETIYLQNLIFEGSEDEQST